MEKKHENYRQLIWMLAITDFKLRYRNSVLGYVWALLQPLLLFLILNFVFSSVFARGGGQEFYSLQLITSLMIFLFFVEGTSAGLNSLVAKQQLVTKIYVPRWTIIIASTLNAVMIFLMNLVVIIGFFIWYQFMPGMQAIGMFFVFIVMLYLLILGFSLFAAPLYVRLRDLSMIWQVVTRAMMYLSPIIYPLSVLPEQYHKWILLNPLAFIIHFNKESLINGHFAHGWQYLTFCFTVIAIFIFGVIMYQRQAKKIAEYI